MDWKSKSGWLISMNLVFAFGALTIFYILNAAFGQPWYPDSVLYTHTQNIKGSINSQITKEIKE